MINRMKDHPLRMCLIDALIEASETLQDEYSGKLRELKHRVTQVVETVRFEDIAEKTGLLDS